MQPPGRVSKEGRVLVVDDEPMVRDTLGQVLVEEGYVVDVAIDGASALAAVHNARPDAILLDLMMPGMNGRQFLQELRADSDYAQVPVLLMTAVHGMSVNLAAAGASELLEKPFDVDDLLNKVALAVYRSRDALIPERPTTSPLPFVTVPAVGADGDRGAVVIVERDRDRLAAIDLALSARGYTVVSMTRALVQVSRLARALRPRAILVDAGSDGATDVVRELRADVDARDIPLRVFTRADASDDDLVAFVDAAAPTSR
jgi:DNA-binding response OmpR family regulator